MNLKEAFRYQNKISSLIEEVLFYLSDKENVQKIEVTYFRKKVMADAENLKIVKNEDGEFYYRINELMAFLIYLLEEKEKLSAAIRTTKQTLPMDIDSETVLNSSRQQAVKVLRSMALIRSTEKLLTDGGVGYRFNADGNQVSYRCDAKEVYTINFDRNQAKKYLKELNEKANEISVEIDRCLINSDVDYDAPFDANDTLEEVFDEFVHRLLETAKALAK